MIFKAFWAEFHLICIKVFADDENHSIPFDIVSWLHSKIGMAINPTSHQKNYFGRAQPPLEHCFFVSNPSTDY